MALGKQVAEAYIEVNGDLSPFRRDLERARLAAQRAANQMEAHNGKTWKSIQASARKANKAMEKDSESMWKRFGNSADKALKKMGNSWRRMDSTVRLVIGLILAAGDQMATLGSGLAAGGTALISTFGMALANLIPLVATLPGLAYGIGLATSAIGRMKAAGGPAADAIKSIGEAWKNSAVPAFAKQWEDSVISFSNTLADKLSDTSVPTALGKAFAQMTDSFTSVMNSPSYTAFEEAMSTTLAAAIGNLGSGVANLTRGLMELFAAAGPAAERLTNSFRQWGNAWADSMSRMRQDGTLQRVFDTAYKSGGALMNLSGALGRALGSVFMIGAKYGDDLMNSLAGVTNQFTAWSQTAKGQEAINQWFANGVRIIKAMEPLAVGLGRAMNILVTEKSIRQWEGINRSMGEALPMFAEILRVIGSLDLIGALAAAFNGVSTAIAVMSGPLDQIATILGGVLRSAIDAVSQGLISMGVALTGPLEAAVPGLKALGDVLISTFEPMMDIFVTVVKLITSALTPAIEVVSSAMVSLAAPVKQVIALFEDGLKNMLVAIEPAFVSIGNLLGVVAIAFGQFLTAIMPSVALLGTVFTGALTTLMPHLVNLVNIVTGALMPVFSELGKSFAVLGPRFAELTGQLLTFISAGIAQVGPLLATVGTAISGMFTAILPTLSLLGHAFQSMLPSITVVAEVIGSLLMTAISSLAPVLAGLLPLIAGLVADLVMFTAGVAPIVANMFANIVNAIMPLIPIITTLVAQFLGLAATLVGQLLPAILPILEQFGTVFTGALLALMPFITQFAAKIGELAMLFLTQLLPALFPIIATLATGLLTIIMQLVPHFMTVVTVVGELVVMFLTRLLPAIMPLVAAIGSLVSLLVSMLVPAFQVLGAIIQAVMPIIQFVIEGVINNVIGVIQGLTNVIQGVADFFNAIFKGDIKGAWEALGKIIGGAVEAIWNLIQLTFLGKILGGLKAAMTAIVGFFKGGWSSVTSGVSSAWASIVNFISSGISRAVSFVTSGLNNIRSFFSNAFNTIVATVKFLFQNFVNIIQFGIQNAIKFVSQLPGKIGSALSGLGGQMLGIARNMMQGFINGVVGMAGNIFNAAVNAVKGAIDGVKNFLGIRSPSRLAKGLGEYTGEGYALGLDALKGRVKTAAEKMAEAATGAFDRSQMFIAGQDAGAGLADGLIASKAEINGALSKMSKSMTVSAASIGAGPINTGRVTGSLPAAGDGKHLTLAEGAIQIVTPTKDPAIVASKVVDELTNVSML